MAPFRLRLTLVAFALLSALLLPRTVIAQSILLSADTATAQKFQVVSLTATLSGAQTTGTITFFDNGTRITSVPVSSLGTAVLSDAALSPGLHAVTALWSGSPTQSAAVTIAVTGLPTPFTAYADPLTLYAGQVAYIAPMGANVNAQGSYVVSDAGSPIATMTISGTSTGHYNGYGDSITAGAFLDQVEQRYVSLFGSSLGLSYLDRALAGSKACDVITMQTMLSGDAPTEMAAPLNSLMIGTNDIWYGGQSVDDSALFKTCHQADIAWLGVPREYKVMPGDAAVTTTGPWSYSSTYDPTYFTNYETAGTGTLTYRITTSRAPIYLWHLIGDLLAGTYLVRIDGVPTGTVYSSTPALPINSLVNRDYSTGFALDRFAIPPGPHTVEIDVQSGTVGILAVGTAPSTGSASLHPTVLVTDIPNDRTSNPVFPSSYLPLYNSYIQQDIALLQADGLDVRFVPTEQFLLGQDDEYVDQVHPNALGNAHLAAAFAAGVSIDSTAPYSTFAGVPSSGSVQLTTTGVHTLQMSYSGDQNYGPSTASVNINVLPKNQSATTLTSNGTNFTATSPVVLQAAITPATAGGVVNFYDGTSYLAGITVSGGVASFTANFLPGAHNLRCTYSGDPADLDSSSTTLAIQVTLASTTLALAPIPATIPYGTPVPLTASVSPADATGAIAFTDTFTSPGQTQSQTMAAGSASLANGTAALTLNMLSPGVHAFSASYSGDARHSASTAGFVTTTVQPQSSTTTIGSIAPEPFGTATTITATVTPADATGSIVFRDALTGVSTTVPLSSGRASATANLHAGTHPYTATYSGDTAHLASTSATGPALVTQATSTAALSLSAAAIAYGAPATLTASLTPATASGTILFTDPMHGTLGQATLAQGVASLTLPTLDPGAYTITAVYSGDADTTASTSTPAALQVALISTTMALSQPTAASPYSAPLTVTATVAPSASTGSIAFTDSGKPLGTVLLVNGTASVTTAALAPGSHTVQAAFSGDASHATAQASTVYTIIPDATVTTLTLAQANVPAGDSAVFNVKVATPYSSTPTGQITIRSGTTVLATGQLSNATAGSAYATLYATAGTLGTFPVTAFYAGDSDDTSSDSSVTALAFTVVPSPTAGTLTLSAAQVPPQTPVTLTASFTSASQIPTGSVVFSVGTQVLATVPLDAAGHATATAPAQAIGAYSLTAVYTPSGLFAGANVPPQTLTVTAPLTAEITSAPLSLTAGATGFATLLLTPLSGFQGMLTTQCTIPAEILSCTIQSPGSLAGLPAIATVYVTAASGSAALRLPFKSVTGYATALAALLPLLFSRKRRRLGTLLALLIAVSTVTACGTGRNFSKIAPGPQSVQVTVTAAGTSIPVILTVNLQ